MKLSEFVVLAAKALQDKTELPTPPKGWEKIDMQLKTPHISGVVFVKRGEKKQVIGQVKLITQNKAKVGQWGDLARAGHTVTQVWWSINKGAKWGVVVDGKFHVYPKNAGITVNK